MTQETHTLPAVATHAGEGEAIWWAGSLAEIKVTAEQTGGALSILEITEPPNMDGPLHVHHREDEGFWILEGSITLEVGETSVELGPGDFGWGPRGVPHRYSTGDEGCRMLYVMTPGGFEDFVRAVGGPAASRTLPRPSDEEPDWDRIAAAAEAHGCALLA
jgi:mannose-6-phosphate isomerase-like protein (cupin superfamily)